LTKITVNQFTDERLHATAHLTVEGPRRAKSSLQLCLIALDGFDPHAVDFSPLCGLILHWGHSPFFHAPADVVTECADTEGEVEIRQKLHLFKYLFGNAKMIRELLYQTVTEGKTKEAQVTSAEEGDSRTKEQGMYFCHH